MGCLFDEISFVRESARGLAVSLCLRGDGVRVLAGGGWSMNPPRRADIRDDASRALCAILSSNSGNELGRYRNMCKVRKSDP